MFANTWKKRQQNLFAERNTQSTDQGALFGIADAAEGSLPVVKIVLSQLGGYLYEKRLSLRPEDNVKWLLGIDEDEITDLFERSISELGCPLPKQTVVLPKMETVGEIINQVRLYCTSC